MEHDPLYEFFHGFSRIFIVIPIVILVAGLIIRFNQNKPQGLSYKTNQIVSPTKKINTSVINLNLKGPFICNFSSKEATISGYIKNSKVYAQIKKQKETTNIILNDDCIYVWMEKSFDGQKFCGLKQYISMIGNNSALLSNLLSNQSMFPKKTIDIQSVVNSCRKEEIQDERVFELPKNVLFKNKEIPRL